MRKPLLLYIHRRRWRKKGEKEWEKVYSIFANAREKNRFLKEEELDLRSSSVSSVTQRKWLTGLKKGEVVKI